MTAAANHQRVKANEFPSNGLSARTPTTAPKIKKLHARYKMTSTFHRNKPRIASVPVQIRVALCNLQKWLRLSDRVCLSKLTVFFPSLISDFETATLTLAKGVSIFYFHFKFQPFNSSFQSCHWTLSLLSYQSHLSGMYNLVKRTTRDQLYSGFPH